jgi:hypothetical protein
MMVVIAQPENTYQIELVRLEDVEIGNQAVIPPLAIVNLPIRGS